VSRNYSLPTIKTLFGEASVCAYPDCAEPLIFRDRGHVTAVAQIAHIRSESPGGPRHDPDYLGEVDGPENLFLLCGKHHPPVDRHESAYSVAELEMWKSRQRATAGAGTPISETDLRAYVELTADQRRVLADVARLAQRLIGVSETAAEEIARLRAEKEQMRLRSWIRRGSPYSVLEDGTEVPLDSLSMAEQREWDNRIRETLEPYRTRIDEARGALDEEIAVLRMMLMMSGGAVSVAAIEVSVAAAVINVDNDALLGGSVSLLSETVQRLWRIANGLEG
jgi:hypothetical protein